MKRWASRTGKLTKKQMLYCNKLFTQFNKKIQKSTWLLAKVLVALVVNKREKMKNLIRLESIGTALNMKTGMTHPINADGTIDFDEGMATHILYDEGGFDEDGFELYDLADLEDREVIEEYLETTK